VSAVFPLAAALLLSAKPVAKTYRGPMDSVDAAEQSASVLAVFELADKAAAQQVIDASARAQGVSAALHAAFIKTEKATLVAFTLSPQPGRLPFGRFTALAKDLSSRSGVSKAWAVLAPGPRDDTLEGEATFEFTHGAPTAAARLQYRDDPKYVDLVRRRVAVSQWRLARWPSYPASKLAEEVGLPGRSCLDQPWQLERLATEHWPQDNGENLEPVWLELPGGTATEILQTGLREKKSPSAAVTEALKKAREDGALGSDSEALSSAVYDDGQPQAQKHARRTMVFFIPAAELEPAEDASEDKAQSLSRVVQLAWRRMHAAAVHER
jgi:hypothetical protein